MSAKLDKQERIKQLLFLFFLLTAFSLGSCSLDKSSYRVQVNLKVIDSEGHALSGFSVYDEENMIGRTNSFGEWSYFLTKSEREPFFLTLESYQHRIRFSTSVKVDFLSKNKGQFFYEDVIKVPRSSFDKKNLTYFDREIDKAKKIQKSLNKVHFNFSRERLKREENKKELSRVLRLEKALKSESLNLGLEYDFEAKWQIYIESPGEGSSLYKITSTLPYEEENISFYFENISSVKDFAQKLFARLKKEIQYPYKIEKIDNTWFVRIQKLDQKSFWRIDKSIKLKTNLKHVSITGHRKDGGASSYLYPLASQRPHLCNFPDRTYCYLFSDTY